jgi:hypothetical protein
MTDTSADIAVTATSVERPRSVVRKAYLGFGHVLRSYREQVVPSQYGIPDGSVAAVARANPKM